MFPSREKGSCTAEETRKDHAKVVVAGDGPDEVGRRGVANVKTRIGCCSHYHASLHLRNIITRSRKPYRPYAHTPPERMYPSAWLLVAIAFISTIIARICVITILSKGGVPRRRVHKGTCHLAVFLGSGKSSTQSPTATHRL